ncbi:MAG: hypothetical protein IPP66_14245 [Anaerolineales bacterium]|nr:hypothetical protein [Anaerolineales bacterium]
MNPIFKKFISKPILILITINIIIGLFIFRNFGTSWDEPLFYSYGDALGYAYSPHEWFSGHFDLYNSYGASGDDHKNRGPAYLFLAREFVYGLKALGSESTSAWHLVNFLFFQFGIYFLYRISKRWMNESSAFFTAIFFSLQPLLWGHAFINPKDPPFLTFFLASMCFGFEMVDAIAQNSQDKTKKILLASFFLGIATSIRVLGPFAGLLIVLYSISKSYKSNLLVFASQWFKTFFPSILQYGFFTIIIMFATWPFLWENPFKNFVNVFMFMSDNPTHLPVLFGGETYAAGELPRRYFPFMLSTTLTEPTIPLFIIGVVLGFWKLFKSKSETRRDQLVSLSLMFAWFAILVAYIIIRKPAMYDGIRHFLFVLPPVFIFAGLAFEAITDFFSSRPGFLPTWLRAGLGLLLILPGINGIVRLHPYEYTYYNSFIGGTDGAFRNYETEFWLTCYKDAVEQLDEQITTPVNLYVKREAYIAAPYATDNITVIDLRGAMNQVRSGDYVLVNTRTNEDQSTFKDAPTVIEIKRGDATFCIVRQIP